MGTPRYHSDPSWEPYVAEVISSLVIQVLRDDQVFAVLGGEGRGPRRHGPLLCDPLQETMDCSMKIDGYNGMILVCVLFTYSPTCIKRPCIKRSPSIKRSVVNVPKLSPLNYSKCDLY